MNDTKVVIGIDNGVTGAYCIFVGDRAKFLNLMPVNRVTNYTKKEQFIQRIDNEELYYQIKYQIKTFLVHYHYIDSVTFLMERPMINPTRFKQSISAARAFENTLVAFERVERTFCNNPISFSLHFTNDKEWKEHFRFPKKVDKKKIVERVLSYKDFFDAKEESSPLDYNSLQMSALADAYFIAKFGSQILV